jgi:hypothetical protein
MANVSDATGNWFKNKIIFQNENFYDENFENKKYKNIKICLKN